MISKIIVYNEYPNLESRGLSQNSINTVLGTVSCMFQELNSLCQWILGNIAFTSEYLRDSH